MSKLQPNLDILYDKVLEFNVNQPDEYFESVVAYLSENPSQIHDIFDNLVAAFANQQSLLNALQFVFLAVWRLGAPAFFGLESSKILELQLDINMQHDELLELKRIAKYCTDKFQKMQTLHEIPNINQKYNELCHITNEELPLPEVQLTEFEKQYSELAGRYKQFEQLLEQITIETQSSKDSKAAFENSKGIQLLEQIDKLIIQPDQRFTKSENELILNFFHQKYALINKIYLELPLIAHEYQRLRLEKKALRQEKNEEEPKPELPAQNLKDFTSFIEGASLAAFPESMTVEYKDYLFPFKNEELRRKLRSTLCAFLNTNGGRILIGIGNNGFRVKGLFLTTNDQDTLIRDIDTLLKDFHPKVEPEEVNTTFIPVKKKDNTYKPGFYVVKIAVKRGKPNELYFTGRDCYKRRNGQNDVQMPANFKRDIIERAAITIQTHPDLFKDRGEYNDPAPELGAPVTNVKEKQPNEIKPIKAAGPKQKQNQPAPAGSTKLSIKNIPAIPDVEMGLKALLSTIGPATKTVNFTKDNECVLTFTKSEEAKSFLEYAETNPIVLGPNILQFNMKPFEKEKPEKKQIKVEIEEEKKEPVVKVKTDNTSIIWVRGITENTGDLKDKLTQMLGPFSTSLKDIKIHNKKKRATLEFESSAQANQVLAYLTMEDRFLGETKVSFEKASPPSSPNHGSKPIELGKPNAKNESAKAKQSKAEGPKEVPKVTEITESNAIKISNISMEPNAQIGYLINACGHLIKKAVERQVFQDHALFFFKDKEEAKKAYTFLIENNFTFQGRKLKVEYFIPIVQNVEPQMPTMNYPNQGLVRSEAVHTERLYPTFDMPDLLASLPVLPHGQVNQYQQFNAQNMYQAPPNNLLDSGPIQHDPNALDFLIQQHQLLQQNLFENPPEHQNQPAHENQQSLESQKIQSATIPANPLKDQIDLDFETLQLDIQKLNRSLSSPRAETQSDDVTDPQNAIDSQQNPRAGSLNDGLAFSFNPTANKEAGEQRERFMTPAFPQGQGPLVSQQDNATQQPQMNTFMHMVSGKQQSSPSVLEQSGAFNAQNAQSQGLLPSEQSKEGVPTQTHDQNQNVNQNMPPAAHAFNTAPANLSVQSIQNMSQGFRPMSEGAQSMSQFGQGPQDMNQPGLPANVQGSKTVFGRPSAENALPPINLPQGPNQAMPSQPQEIKSVFGRPPQQNMTSLNPPSMTTQEQQKSQGTQPVDNLNQNTQQQQGPYPQYSQFPQSTQQTGFPQMGSQGNQQINPNQFVPNPMGGAPQQQNIQRPGPQPPGNQPPANMPVSPQQNANQQFVLNPNYFTQSLQKPTVQPSGPQGIPSQPTIQPPTNMGQQQQIPQQNLQQPNVPGNQNAGQQGPGTGTGPQNQNMPPYPQSGNPNMPPGFPQGLNTGNQQGIQQNSNLPQHLQTQQTPQNSYPPGVNVNANFGMSTPSNLNPNVNPNMNPNQWQQNQNQNANMGNNMGSMQQDPKSHMPQQSYPGYQYPNQQFNQGQFGNPQYQQNANPQGQGQGQGQYFNQQGQQYPTQQGQFPMQQQPYPMQPGQYPSQFQGQQGQYPYPQGYPNQMGAPQGSQFQPTNTKATGKPDPKDSKKQSGKNQSQTKNQTQQGKNQQQLQPQIQGQMPIPGQLQSSQQVPPGMMGNYQNYGMNANYQGYPGPNNQMPGTGPSGYGQSQMGYGANPNMQNQQQNPMYQNMQGNIPGNMQGSMQQGVPNYQNAQNFNTQGLTPQQIQQMQMQQQMQQQMPQMQYYGGQQQYPPNMGMNPNVRSK